MSSIADGVSIHVTMDNYYDGLLITNKNVHRFGYFWPGISMPPLPPVVISEHGFACCVEITAGDEKNTLLFDFGLSKEGTAYNMKAMGLNNSEVKAAVLSHGHFDHFSGFEKAVEGLPAGVPLYVGEDVFLKRYTCLPNMKIDLGALDPAIVRAAGMEIREINQATEILPGVMLIGPIPRITDFEKGSPALMMERGTSLVQDNFDDELSLAFNVKGKGLIILTACAHTGIVNIVKQAIKVTGVDRVHAILGGFHLTGAPEQKIIDTIIELKLLSPDLVVPMHCTGFQATKMFSDMMPEAFGLYSTGSRFLF